MQIGEFRAVAFLQGGVPEADVAMRSTTHLRIPSEPQHWYLSAVQRSACKASFYNSGDQAAHVLVLSKVTLLRSKRTPSIGNINVP